MAKIFKSIIIYFPTKNININYSKSIYSNNFGWEESIILGIQLILYGD
jgi:hypothetical protein